MKTKILLVSLVLFQLLLVLSCASRSASNDTKPKLIRDKSPEGLFREVKGFDSPETDSIYQSVFDQLIDSNKFAVIEKHLSFYERIKSSENRSTALYNRVQAWVVSTNGEYDSSIVLFSHALAAYKSVHDVAGISDAYFGIGVNKMYLGKYDDMFSNLLHALDYAGKSGDSLRFHKVNTALANGYLANNELDKAISTVQLSMNYFKRVNRLDAVAYCQSLISRVYNHQGAFEKSIVYSLQALEYRRNIKDTSAISASLNNIAASYMALGQWDKALAGFEESLLLLELLNHRLEIPIVKYNIANCLWKSGHDEQAESTLLRLIEDAKKQDGLPMIVAGYKLLSEINRDKKQFEKAYRYALSYKEYNDRIFDQEKQKVSKELIVKYETLQKEARIKKLSVEQRENQIKIWLYLSLLLACLLVLVFLIFLLRIRNRINRLKLEQTRVELQKNAAELQRFTEHIIRKNNQIEQLEHSLLITRETELKSLNNEQVSELYRLKILTEEDWQNFKNLFNKVYPGFLNNLRKNFPEITPSEERQSLLIKLNLNNKECASMLGISLDGIKKSRYRLRKRFLLDEETDLDVFVKTM